MAGISDPPMEQPHGDLPLPYNLRATAKPCPFCGGKDLATPPMQPVVCCGTCEASGPFGKWDGKTDDRSILAAYVAWNKRADVQSSMQPRDLLRAKERLALRLATTIAVRYFEPGAPMQGDFDIDDARIWIAAELPDSRAEAEAEVALWEETVEKHQLTPPPGESILAQLRGILRLSKDAGVKTTLDAAAERITELREACAAVLATLDAADLHGETLWIMPPHQGAGVHETAQERLEAVLNGAK